jgi:AraC-like DNA-binding protein
MDEVKFGVEVLGKELGLSRTHLFRKFKSLTGTAPNDFIRHIRLKKAAQLIKDRKYSISEIAYMVGFKTPAHFSTSFKAFYGLSPKEYQGK